MSQQIVKHSFTVDDFELMGRTGILPPDRRMELLEGEVYDMSPIGMAHAACVNFLLAFLNDLRNGRFNVSGQNPIRLSDNSEPQPDVALLRWRDDFYRAALPAPADVLLIIEVADSSLDFDRRDKLPAYAKARIPETWIVNLSAEQVEVHTEPVAGEYRVAQIFRRGETVQARTVDGVAISIDDIFG